MVRRSTTIHEFIQAWFRQLPGRFVSPLVGVGGVRREGQLKSPPDPKIEGAWLRFEESSALVTLSPPVVLRWLGSGCRRYRG
jgi:hypothetical protein